MLFIISDDLNNALGCYGHPMVQSPNIDRLAQEGLRFDRAYCQFPLCNPSRASMLTGMMPHQTRIYGNGTHIRERFPEVVTLPQMFKNNGYFTARVGKIFHYGVPGQIGTDGLDDADSWDYVFNPIGVDKEREDEIYTLLPGKYGGTLSWMATEEGDEEHTDGIGATEALRLLEEPRDGPFFLAMGFYRPHTPYVAPQTYFDLYPLEDIPLPEPQEVREPRAAFLKAKPEHDLMTDQERREAIQAYYASVTFMDAQVGRLLDALDRLGLRDNTVVVMTSDHGYHLGEHSLWQKRSLFENSARVPMIISAPGAQAKGRASNRPAELVDLYPTLAELCGLEMPHEGSGISLAPLLDDPTAPTKRVALTEEYRRVNENDERINFMGHTIRTERWRYTEWEGGARGVELYEYATDPEELHNLADEENSTAVLSEMRRLLAERLERTADVPESLREE